MQNTSIKKIYYRECSNCSYLKEERDDDAIELWERPEFPYPEISEEYRQLKCREEKSHMEEKYPLIKTYNEELRKWRAKKSREMNRDKLCPKCRR